MFGTGRMNIIEVLTMAVKLKDEFIEEAFASANIFGYLLLLPESR